MPALLVPSTDQAKPATPQFLVALMHTTRQYSSAASRATAPACLAYLFCELHDFVPHLETLQRLLPLETLPGCQCQVTRHCGYDWGQQIP